MKIYSDLETCVEAALAVVGKRIVLGIPLGIGKPNPLVNALYERAKKDSSIHLVILTALSFNKPTWKNDLERRLEEPIVDRLFNGYPNLRYLEDLGQRKLPANIEVREFFLNPGRYLNNPRAQQSYIASNYTHVVRDALDQGINLFMQAVAPANTAGYVSLGSNPDLTLDLEPHLKKRRRNGTPTIMLAQELPAMPFMEGDAVVPLDFFDGIVRNKKYDFPLFAPPAPPVHTADYFIGIAASALVKDGGTLQLGIGALDDALTYALILRQKENPFYQKLLRKTPTLQPGLDLMEKIGGLAPLKDGVYAVTEMLVPGFLQLYHAGILKRKVYSGPESKGGVCAHAGFFVGPRSFYNDLRNLTPEQRKDFNMTAISFINQLYGNEELKIQQRKDARFFNTAMMATAIGAIISDGLSDGRVVSGVGGQYNFVAMAHALPGGRSILMVRSTRFLQGHLHSNLVWNYGHETIPRHLRDLLITEYGIADLRGKTDEVVIQEILKITDSRFQESLLNEAKKAGKISPDYRLPESARTNLPQRLEDELRLHRQLGYFGDFPFGTDFSPEEEILIKGLEHFKVKQGAFRRAKNILSHLHNIISTPKEALPYLQRLQLDRPKTLSEILQQKIVLYALAGISAI